MHMWGLQAQWRHRVPRVIIYLCWSQVECVATGVAWKEGVHHTVGVSFISGAELVLLKD